jgi:hypothetical protein
VPQGAFTFTNTRPGVGARAGAISSAYSEPGVTVDVELHESLVEIFTQAVMNGAALPAARREDVQEAPTFSSRGGEILCTCDITGATYSESWDGTSAWPRRLRGQ